MTEDKSKMTRRKYLKYAAGIVGAGVIAAAGYGIFETTQPVPKPPTPAVTPTMTATVTPGVRLTATNRSGWNIGDAIFGNLPDFQKSTGIAVTKVDMPPSDMTAKILSEFMA